MTPKEKAKELINKYWITINEIELDFISWNQAKHCALICVNEIIISLTQYGKDSNELQNMDRELNYWNEVKQEIEKL